MIVRILLALALFSVDVALAQPTAGNDVITVVYPVAEMVVPISTRLKLKTIPTSENELMALLSKKVAPASWEQVGGVGTMRYDRQGYALHVRQTPKIHLEVKAFLAQLLRGQVSVEMRIVSITEKGFDEMERSSTSLARIQWTKKDGIDSALLDDVKVLRFLEAVQGDHAAHILQMPKITMFDEQDATTQAGTWTQKVGVEFDGNNKPVPVQKTEKVFEGTKARLLPTISADRRSITVQAEISRTQQFPTGEMKLAVVAKVPDQRTVAILAGTMMVEERTEYGPPVLSRIPYVSRLFRTVGWSRESARLIVLLTPRIIADEESAEVGPLRTEIQAADNGKFPKILPPGGR